MYIRTKFGDYSASKPDFRDGRGLHQPLPEPTKHQKSSTVVGFGDFPTWTVNDDAANDVKRGS